jgi:hypothetical protein
MPGVGKRGRPGPSAPHIEIGSVSPFRHPARSTDCAKRRTLVTRLRGVNGSCALRDRHGEICLDQRTDATLVALIHRALAPAGRARRDANPRIGSPSGNGFAGSTRRRACSSTSWAAFEGRRVAPNRHPFDLSRQWPYPAKGRTRPDRPLPVAPRASGDPTRSTFRGHDRHEVERVWMNRHLWRLEPSGEPAPDGPTASPSPRAPAPPGGPRAARRRAPGPGWPGPSSRRG